MHTTWSVMMIISACCYRTPLGLHLFSCAQRLPHSGVWTRVGSVALQCVLPHYGAVALINHYARDMWWQTTWTHLTHFSIRNTNMAILVSFCPVSSAGLPCCMCMLYCVCVALRHDLYRIGCGWVRDSLIAWLVVKCHLVCVCIVAERSSLVLNVL